MEANEHTSDPTASAPSATNNIRRLPYMSPARPSNGVATAPVSNVRVTTHPTSTGAAPVAEATAAAAVRRQYTSVVTIPPAARTAMTRRSAEGDGDGYGDGDGDDSAMGLGTGMGMGMGNQWALRSPP